jgi:thiamine biosynthesis lipoprotein
MKKISLNQINHILRRVIVLFAAACSFSGCTKNAVSLRTEQVLGTVCTINAYDSGTKTLYDELFSRLHEIEDEFSVNKATSEVSKVNDAAGDHPVAVTGDVLYVIKEALEYARISNGAFDPTIGPLVKLWGINTDHARVPSQHEIDGALPLVNWRDVVITGDSSADGGTVFLKRKGMSIDLGGIAKGYAADEMVRILKSYNAQCAVIDLGGNIFVYGTKKGGAPWKVGVKDPDNDEGAPALVLTLSNSTTVVTSGVYERYFIQDGKRYHHILDTKTGYPAQSGLLSSTIVTDSSIAADALSTISFILGEEKFNALMKSADEQNIRYVFINENHQVLASSGLENVLKSNSAEYNAISFVYDN